MVSAPLRSQDPLTPALSRRERESVRPIRNVGWACCLLILPYAYAAGVQGCGGLALQLRDDAGHGLY